MHARTPAITSGSTIGARHSLATDENTYDAAMGILESNLSDPLASTGMVLLIYESREPI